MKLTSLLGLLIFKSPSRDHSFSPNADFIDPKRHTKNKIPPSSFSTALEESMSALNGLRKRYQKLALPHSEWISKLAFPHPPRDRPLIDRFLTTAFAAALSGCGVIQFRHF